MRAVQRAVMVGLLLGSVPAATTEAAEALTYDHVHLGVPDPKVATEWYVKYLGAARRPDGMPGVFFGPTRFNMRITEKPTPSAGAVVDHVALSYADVAATVAEIGRAHV
mgnify:CR=1 FL=1